MQKIYMYENGIPHKQTVLLLLKEYVNIHGDEEIDLFVAVGHDIVLQVLMGAANHIHLEENLH